MASPTRQPRDSGDKPQTPAKPHPAARIVLIAGLCLAVVVAAWGLIARQRAAAALRTQTEQASIPTVTLAKAGAEPAAEEITLSGNVQANYEAPIYARTNGYVQQWYTDIGTPVKAGQLLALLETPDVDDELHQAEADLATAKANNDLAQSTARRWIMLRQTNSVSQQDADEKIGDASAKKAAVASAAANVARLRQMQDWKRVVAPFDGVVTARLTDVGALITSGTSTVLFRVADTSRLRIYTEVPQTYVSNMKQGGEVDLSFAEFPGRIFKARIARTSDALDPATRTLMVELALDNRDGTLLPGGYTEVHFAARTGGNFVRVPVSALLFRADGLHVVTVSSRWSDQSEPGRDKGDNMARIALKTVTIGRDYGTSLELTTGIKPGETIVIDPPDSATDGETVRVDTTQSKT